MTKKFTKSEADIIVGTYNLGAKYGSVEGGLSAVLSALMREEGQDDKSVSFAMALANPETRDLAYDKYVEKEKKYYWASKKEDENDLRKRLYKKVGGASVRDYFDNEFLNTYVDEQLTETEIREWGYNPEAFEKVEVH